ncbi:MAG: tRNA (guanosine(46)-N7)-methyltransferase TrmB [Candidatus Poribacteria bacterium]|nr:tRNA (guanosine(46)-N7)-methyltransferase TrmB [Candidatus Poribacteria bacterium]
MTESQYDRFFEIIATRSALIDLRENAEVDLAEIERPIDWHQLFCNANPVEIEVGCGRGRFLLESAKRYPEINYVGLERARKYADRTRERFIKHIRHTALTLGERHTPDFANMRLVWSDAAYFIDRYVADGSVQAYHVYFPDPWPRKRHRKRRLFRNEVWLRGLTRTLDPNGGCLHIATDYAEYFYEIHYKLTELPLVYVPPDSIQIEHIQTNFEMKYRTAGRKIYRAVYQLNG